MKTLPTSVVVTGMGALSPLGTSVPQLWAAVLQGHSAITAVTRFDVSGYAIQIAGTIPDPTWNARLRPLGQSTGRDPCADAAIVAAREAWSGAGFVQQPPDARRVGIVLGTSSAGLYSRSSYEFSDPAVGESRMALLEASGFPVQTHHVAQSLGILGPRMTVSTACTSSTNATAHGIELLRSGLADVVLVGGVDLIVQEAFAGFYAMGAMSASPCAPFSEPVGMSLGEGAAWLVLETPEHARERNATVRAVVLGYGLSLDGYHATAPDPTGSGIARALNTALFDAGIPAERVGYLNAHGTGTDANDPAEWRAIRSVFGERANALPVSSTKSYFGHALGAAGALELIVTVCSLESAVTPPTLQFTEPRADSPTDPVASSVPRACAFDIAVKDNAAFGGANAAIVLGTSHCAVAEIPLAARREVFVLGVGTVGPHGLDGLDTALRQERTWWNTPLVREERGEQLPPCAGRVPRFDLADYVRGFDPRGVDLLSSFVTATASLALRDAGIKVRAALRDRIGIIAGLSGLSSDSIDEFWDSIRERGFPRVSVPAFARMVMNAPVGVASRALGLRGSSSVLAGGFGSSLAAIALSSMMLSHRTDADVMIAGGACALGRARLSAQQFRRPIHAIPTEPFRVYGHDRPEFVMSEGAAMVVLGTSPLPDRSPLARIAGFAMGGPGELSFVLRAALAMAHTAPNAVVAVYACASGLVSDGRAEVQSVREVFGVAVPVCNIAPSLGCIESIDALSFVAAVEAIRHGHTHRMNHPAVDGVQWCVHEREIHKGNVLVVMSTDEHAGTHAIVIESV